MTHLTHTGYYAGTPFCDINKFENLQDDYAHVPIKNSEKFLARPEICPECLKIWNDAAEPKLHIQKRTTTNDNLTTIDLNDGEI